MKLIYLANIRMPTEKAHGLQIIQNCEAFADAGAEVQLWVARRQNTEALAGVDPFAHYGVKRNFSLLRLFTVDLIWVRRLNNSKVIFALQMFTFILSAMFQALVTSADVFYSRDAQTLVMLSLFKRRHQFAYEAHSLAKGRVGRWFQKQAVLRCGSIFATTQHLKNDLVELGALREHVFVAHDGIRAARFENLPDQQTARRQIGWPQDAFIVGYVGRLQTMAMDKGVGTLVRSLSALESVSLGLVGGPDEHANQLRGVWLEQGKPADQFLYAGQVKPDDVPLYLRAFDVCVMPFPFTPHFAYYASPIKLFEYLASGRPVVATELPSTLEVVQQGQTAILVPPDDVHALTQAILRLQMDEPLRIELGENGHQLVITAYTWGARTAMILDKLNLAIAKSTTGAGIE